MVSLVNPYFNQSKLSEQEIINGFVKESIQILGKTYYYLPRNIQIADLILGEDILSKFTLAIPIEMYLTDTMGFQGDREMFSKFGLEIKNSYKLVVSKDRWEEEIRSQFDNLSSNGEADFDISNYIRPLEGDLIYDPITKFLMEIKFVDHDVEFFALEKNYQYYLSCEAFQYQGEEIDTIIDRVRLIMENDNAIILEGAGTNYLLMDQPSLGDIRPKPPDFSPEVLEIEYSVINPFGI